jgi:hypothetical protein
MAWRSTSPTGGVSREGPGVKNGELSPGMFVPLIDARFAPAPGSTSPERWGRIIPRDRGGYDGLGRRHLKAIYFHIEPLSYIGRFFQDNRANPTNRSRGAIPRRQPRSRDRAKLSSFDPEATGDRAPRSRDWRRLAFGRGCCPALALAGASASTIAASSPKPFGNCVAIELDVKLLHSDRCAIRRRGRLCCCRFRGHRHRPGGLTAIPAGVAR